MSNKLKEIDKIRQHILDSRLDILFALIESCQDIEGREKFFKVMKTTSEGAIRFNVKNDLDNSSVINKRHSELIEIFKLKYLIDRDGDEIAKLISNKLSLKYIENKLKEDINEQSISEIMHNLPNDANEVSKQFIVLYCMLYFNPNMPDNILLIYDNIIIEKIIFAFFIIKSMEKAIGKLYMQHQSKESKQMKIPKKEELFYQIFCESKIKKGATYHQVAVIIGNGVLRRIQETQDEQEQLSLISLFLGKKGDPEDELKCLIKHKVYTMNDLKLLKNDENILRKIRIKLSVSQITRWLERDERIKNYTKTDKEDKVTFKAKGKNMGD